MEQPHNDPQSDPTPKPDYARNIRNPFILAALPGDNTFRKYLGGALFILGIWAVGSYLSIRFLFGFVWLLYDVKVTNYQELVALGVDKNIFYLFVLIGFIVGVLGIWATMKFMHGRSFRTLITYKKRINWKKIGIAFLIYIALNALLEGWSYYQNPENYINNFQPEAFFSLLFITIVFLPFQTSFEELFFRGYLLQGFSFLCRYTFPALLLSSLIFALMHSWNPEIELFGFFVMFPYYFSFGLLVGYIALKDKGLEIPLAVHFANNVFSSLFFTFKGSAQNTDALFIVKEMDPIGMMPINLALMLVFLLICSFVFGWWKKAGTDSILAS